MLRIERRFLRDISNPLEIPEERFVEIFRLKRETTKILIENLTPYMRDGIRTTFVPVPLRVCAALHFFATGSLQRDIGQDFLAALSKTMISRCVKEVANILQRDMMNNYIKFPNPNENDSIKQRFYEKSSFPGVIGAIDCTHVKIKNPGRDVEHCYMNRKGYFSKNVQLVCDYNLKILSVNARYAGATHDAFIFDASQVNTVLEERYAGSEGNQAWLLGDSGYPLRPWIITPFKSSTDEREHHFNYKHAQGRNCVERLNGVLKRVFQCLSSELRLSPDFAGTVINACCVLHNFKLSHGDNDDIVDVVDISLDNINGDVEGRFQPDLPKVEELEII